MTRSPESEDQSKRNYMQYAGMAFEIVGLLVVAVFIGGKLDKWMSLEQPYMTVGLLMLFFIAYFLKIYYSLTK